MTLYQIKMYTADPDTLGGPVRMDQRRYMDYAAKQQHGIKG